MPVDPRRRQKKLERRKAKQKEARREMARRESQSPAARFSEAALAPILHCCAGATIWEQGLGDVLVSRQLPGGRVAFVVFLVDMYCLGVKDVVMNVVPRAYYDGRVYAELMERMDLSAINPECARKLVEGAVHYARDLGLPPHPDYRAAQMIFGDLDAGACPEQYTYGKDGRPFFIAGPNDTPERCQRILRTLEQQLGPDGFHFILPLQDLPPL